MNSDAKPMNCKTLQSQLPDLLLDATAVLNPAAVAHLDACPPCKHEYISLRSTMTLLDLWVAPEPSPYFDQKMAVRLREEIAEPRMNWFERVRTRLTLNTGRQLRPLLTGALATALLVGGGTVAGFRNYLHPMPVEASSAVTDLQILDRNEQAFQQMDQLLQDEDGSGSKDAPDSTPLGSSI